MNKPCNVRQSQFSQERRKWACIKTGAGSHVLPSPLLLHQVTLGQPPRRLGWQAARRGRKPARTPRQGKQGRQAGAATVAPAGGPLQEVEPPSWMAPAPGGLARGKPTHQLVGCTASPARISLKSGPHGVEGGRFGSSNSTPAGWEVKFSVVQHGAASGAPYSRAPAPSR